MTDSNDDGDGRRGERRPPRARKRPSSGGPRGGPRGPRAAVGPGGDKGARGHKPFRRNAERGERPSFGKPGSPPRKKGFGDRPDRGDRPFRPRREGEPAEGFGSRSRDDDRGGKPFGRKPSGGQSFGDRPSGRRFEDKPFGDRPRRGKPFGVRPPRGDKPFGDKPRRDKPYGVRPPRDDRPAPRRVLVDAADFTQAPAEPERIAKVIARAGIASRRDAEAMIAEGRVTLNGAVLTSPAINVTDKDTITIDGETLPARERTRLFLFHKPRGLVTTARDPEGRPTVFDDLPEDMPRVVAVGRLDINTEGLLLLTNDGGLARVIAHPETGWLRRYKVRAHGEITQADLDPLIKGITIDRIEYGPIEATLDRVQGDNAWLTLGLREGKNREIKRVLEHLGLSVNRLIRLSFGPFQLGDLEPGLVEEVRTRVLRDQLGESLAEKAGVDFVSPVREPLAPEREARPSREAPRRDQERGGGERFPRREGERSFASRGGKPSDRDAPRGRPQRAHVAEHGNVWRSADAPPREKARRGPRPAADAKAARVEAGSRRRETVGAIDGPKGRHVVVERAFAKTRGKAEAADAPPRGKRPPRPGGGKPGRPPPRGRRT